MNKKRFTLARLRGLLLLPLLVSPLLGLTGCIVEPGVEERGRGHVEIEPRHVEVEPVIVVEPDRRR